jgi:hypothetical protein
VGLFGVSGCGGATGTSASGTTEETTPLASATTTEPPFTMETCGGIITDPNLQPGVNLEGFLLTSADVPNGYASKGPHTTGSAGPEFDASVPSVVPVAYVDYAMNSGPVQPDSQASSVEDISETIGRMGSADLAAQMVTRIEEAAEQEQCGRDIVRLPGPVPDLVAMERSGSSSAGSLVGATVLVTKGSYVVGVAWTDSTTASPSAAALPEAPAPLPTPAEMGSLVDTALARILG